MRRVCLCCWIAMNQVCATLCSGSTYFGTEFGKEVRSLWFCGASFFSESGLVAFRALCRGTYGWSYSSLAGCLLPRVSCNGHVGNALNMHTFGFVPDDSASAASHRMTMTNSAPLRATWPAAVTPANPAVAGMLSPCTCTATLRLLCRLRPRRQPITRTWVATVMMARTVCSPGTSSRATLR